MILQLCTADMPIWNSSRVKKKHIRSVMYAIGCAFPVQILSGVVCYNTISLPRSADS